MTRKSPLQPIIVAGLLLLTSGTMSSCTQGGTVHPGTADHQRPATEMYQHVVQSGETLGMISDWYTGKSSNWTQIVDANPGLRPERLRLGQVVLIPRNILIKDTPIPKGYSSKKKGGAVVSGNSTGVDSGTDTVKETVTTGKTDADTVETKESVTETSGTEITTGTKTEEDAALEAGKKLDDSANEANAQAEAAAKAADEAALAAKTEAQKAAEKARSDAEAASKAAADAAEGAKTGQKAAGSDDAEREKLLDELLAQ